MKNLFDKLNEAGLFDRYGIKISEGSGVFISTENGEKEVSHDQFEMIFSIASDFVSKPREMSSGETRLRSNCNLPYDCAADNSEFLSLNALDCEAA